MFGGAGAPQVVGGDKPNPTAKPKSNPKPKSVPKAKTPVQEATNVIQLKHTFVFFLWLFFHF